jgi:hypothetical protein
MRSMDRHGGSDLIIPDLIIPGVARKSLKRRGLATAEYRRRQQCRSRIRTWGGLGVASGCQPAWATEVIRQERRASQCVGLATHTERLHCCAPWQRGKVIAGPKDRRQKMRYLSGYTGISLSRNLSHRASFAPGPGGSVD